MPETSPNLILPYIQPAQAQKHVTHNEALRILDALTQLAVLDRGQTVPPSDPDTGARHIVGAGATGVWAGRQNAVAVWDGAAWMFLAPRPGWRAHVTGTGIDVIWSGSVWAPAQDAVERRAALGLNADADAVNRLTVAAPATLLNHDGAGHQLKVNKAGTADTASLLFQTGFSGRAEMGIAGSDDFAIKVSPDGAAWTQALALSASTGLATGAAVQSSPADATPGRLLRTATSATVLSASPALRVPLGGAADAITLTTGASLTPVAGLQLRFRAVATNTGAATLALDGGPDVGCRTVSGAVLPAGYVRTDTDTQATFDGTFWVLSRACERGTNANGSYERRADGSQVCWKSAHTCTSDDTGSEWTYPASFSADPAISITLVGSSARIVGRGVVTASIVRPRMWTIGAVRIGGTVDLTAVGYWY